MEKPFLIQRLKKPFKESSLSDLIVSFGGGLKNGGLSDEAMELIKNIFRFDYMGSAEFEWGAVPKTLLRIANNHKSNISFEITVKTKENKCKTVYVICDKSVCQEVINWIRLKAFDEYDKNYWTKERVGLQYAVNDDGILSGVRGWLELDNGFFFFTDKEMFEKTRELFGVELYHSS